MKIREASKIINTFMNVESSLNFFSLMNDMTCGNSVKIKKNMYNIDLKGTVMQIEKTLIDDRLRVSKVS